MLDFQPIDEGISGEEAAERILDNVKLLEGYTNNMGVTKAAFAFKDSATVAYEEISARLRIYSNASRGSLHFSLASGAVMFTRNRLPGGAGFVEIEPVTLDMAFGDCLVLSKSPSDFIPVGPEDSGGISTYILKYNILTLDLSLVPFVLAVWYPGGFISFFDTLNRAYENSRDFGSELWIYRQGGVTVNTTWTGGAISVVIAGGDLPIIFNKNTFQYSALAAGTYNIPNGFWAVLSTSATEYLRPQIDMPNGTPLYIINVPAGDLNFYDNPIVLGISVDSGQFITKYDVLKIKVSVPTGALYPKLFGKKVNAQGDSITEQNFYTSYMATASGCIIQNRGVSGTGYVQDQGTGSTMYTRSALIAAAAPDAISLFAGTNDWAGIAFAGSPLGSAATSGDVTTFYGAVYQTLKRIREQNPVTPLLVCTPLQRNYNNTEPRPFVNSLGLKLIDYANVIKEVAPIFAANVLDLYNMSGITYENVTVVTSDGVHLNTAGGAIIGALICEELNRMMHP